MRRPVMALPIVLSLGCGDRLHDAEVDALGGEAPGMPIGPLHRPGQPCGVCHGPEGPAEHGFSLAGTVFAHPADKSGLGGVAVLFMDASGAVQETVTNCAGNFYLSADQYRPTFPVWVKSRFGGATVRMYSPINREASCASCHRDPLGPSAVGQIYVAPDGVDASPGSCGEKGTVGTLAGSPLDCGYANGPGAVAQFNYPAGVAVDVTGNLYVGDGLNGVVRAISPAGFVTTVAGDPARVGMIADGSASSAGFANVGALSLDGRGNLIASDACLLRKIDAEGRVSTLAGNVVAGSPVCGYRDDDAENAQFGDAGGAANGVAVDGDGNVFVADRANHAIRKLDVRTGKVTTLAGAGSPGFVDGIGAEARFQDPSGVAVAPDGSIDVADSGNHRIRRVGLDGTVTTVAGDGTAATRDGMAQASSFESPWGLAFDGTGSLYISDSQANLIRKMDENGTVSTVAGNGFAGGKDGESSKATFDAPEQIAVGSEGRIYVVDAAGCTIRVVTP